MAVKISSVVKQLHYVLKLFRVTACCVHSFRICSKETFKKHPVLDMIQRIHLRCGSFGSIIRFWISVRKRNIRFRIKNPDLDFSKETYPEKISVKFHKNCENTGKILKTCHFVKFDMYFLVRKFFWCYNRLLIRSIATLLFKLFCQRFCPLKIKITQFPAG